MLFRSPAPAVYICYASGNHIQFETAITEAKLRVRQQLAPNRNLKYNDYVVYDNKVFKIKGVEIAEGLYNPILLSGYDADFRAAYGSCIVDRKAMKKQYTLWVDPSEIFALNDTVILKESNVEYKIVAIVKPDYPILLNGYTDYRVNIDEIKKRDIRCDTPEAYEERIVTGKQIGRAHV